MAVGGPSPATAFEENGGREQVGACWRWLPEGGLGLHGLAGLARQPRGVHSPGLLRGLGAERRRNIAGQRGATEGDSVPTLRRTVAPASSEVPSYSRSPVFPLGNRRELQFRGR